MILLLKHLNSSEIDFSADFDRSSVFQSLSLKKIHCASSKSFLSYFSQISLPYVAVPRKVVHSISHFATKLICLHFSVGEEASVGIYKTCYFCFQILFLTFATSQKQIESVSSQRVFERIKFIDFERRAANKRMSTQKICSIPFFS